MQVREKNSLTLIFASYTSIILFLLYKQVDICEPRK